MTDHKSLANKLAALPLDQGHDRWPMTKEFRLSETERDLLVAILRAITASENRCPKCGDLPTYQTPDGTYWDGNAHYWRDQVSQTDGAEK